MPAYYYPQGGFSTTNCATAIIFPRWIAQTSITTTQTIWTTFVNGATTSTSNFHAINAAPQYTAEQMAEYEQARVQECAIYRERERVALLARRRAKRKALSLLLKYLHPQQRDEFRQFGYFHVIGGKTGTRYRIKRGRVANVEVYEGDKLKKRLCAHPNENCPDEDTMLAQALHLGLAANEEAFLLKANVHPIR